MLISSYFFYMLKLKSIDGPQNSVLIMWLEYFNQGDS